MDTALDEVAFLANSDNRVGVLEALAETPQSRYELLDVLDSSRVTIGRILREFDNRHWIVRSGQDYELTPLGTIVIDELTSLVETIKIEQRLRQIVPWLPLDQLSFDITCLSDAEIILPTESDPTAPLRRAAEATEAGKHLRFLSYQVTLPIIELLWEGVVHGGQTFEGVGTPAVYDTMLTEPALAAKSQELFDADTTTFFVHPDIDMVVNIIDDQVYIGAIDDEDNPRALVCSDDETVYEWAVDTFERYHEGAELFDPDAFTE